MTRPGVEISSRADVPPRSAPTAADAAFLIGKTTTGTTPALVRSMTQYEAAFGARASATDAYDAAECYFREGGSKLTVSPCATIGALAASLAALSKDLGPGQIFYPGSSGADPTAYSPLMAHAAANNRIALLHAAPTATASALGTLAATLRADVNARYGALFAPAAIVPGVAGGTSRTVSYDALAAGIMARNDLLNGVNDPAAGSHGTSRFATDLALVFTDAERATLNTAGVDVARSVYGQIQTYGYRTVADPALGWGLLSNARLNMAITAELDAVAQRYVFAQIDGRRVKINQFGADLVGVLVPYYESGQLYGETAQDAFFVDVGAAINTDTTIANGELHAVVGIKMSPFAEWVVIEIVKVAIDQPLALVA
jgi:hypothetical protein